MLSDVDNSDFCRFICLPRAARLLRINIQPLLAFAPRSKDEPRPLASVSAVTRKPGYLRSTASPPSSAAKECPVWKAPLKKTWLGVSRLFDQLVAYAQGGLRAVRRLRREIPTLRQRNRVA
jgi:hypothetical protein